MWSKKVRYAVRMLLVLALHRDRSVSAREAARDYGIPSKYLELILSDLRRAGLVESSRGKGGGYRLAGDPGLITVEMVVGAFEEGRRRPSGRAALSGGDGPHLSPEEPILEHLDAAMRKALARVTIADALVQWQSGLHVPSFSI